MDFYWSYTLLFSLPVFHALLTSVSYISQMEQHLPFKLMLFHLGNVTVACNYHSKTSRRLTYTGTDESKQFMFSYVLRFLSALNCACVFVDVTVTAITCFDSLTQNTAVLNAH